jgi:hypothetical protein
LGIPLPSIVAGGETIPARAIPVKPLLPIRVAMTIGAHNAQIRLRPGFCCIPDRAAASKLAEDA